MDQNKEKIIARQSKLSPAKQALLEKRLRGEVKSDSPLKFIPRRSSTEPAPLSFAQQRLWFLQQLEPDNPFYNQHGALQLTGSLDVAALEQSLNEIVRRHEPLRTTFKVVEGQPVQVIAPALNVMLPVVNLRELPKAEQKAEIQQLATEHKQRPFDLVQGPLLRWTLLQLDEQKYVLLLTMHHIIYDGWSLGVLRRELTVLYEAFCEGQPSPLPALPIQYADFAVWQRQWLQAEVLESQISYWKRQLDGAPTVLELPTDYPRPAVGTFRGATYSFELSQELSVALNKLSQQEGSTLFMTLLAAFKTLLHRYTGSEDIVVGSPIANRNRAEIEGLIGYFVNTLVLRTDLSDNPTFQELLGRVREVAIGAYANQDLPFEQLIEKLQPQRSLSHTPLFQVMFAPQNTPRSEIELSGLTLSSLESDSGGAKFDLTLEMEETGEGLMGTLEYNTDLFEATTITRMLGHFQTLLSGIVANPQQRLSELPLLSEPEQYQLLAEWNDTQVEYPQQQCIHQLFEAQVELTPDSVAVVFEDSLLTYQELNARANQLAHHLRSLGVGPEVLVGICVERSLHMVIGLLGILKAGAAYVPLDPSYPQERLAFMLENSQPSVLLTQQHLVESLPTHTAKVVCLDSNREPIAQQRIENPGSNITSDNLAYVIYTSGSTGRPKGAMNTHRGICNRLLWMQDAYQLTAADKVLQKTPFSFDVSVWEFFWPLMTGAGLVVAQPEGNRDTNYLVKLITQQQISTLHFVPSMLQVFLEAENLETCKSLKRVIASGEALPAQLQKRFFNRLDAQLHNLYGPTEAAVDVTFWACAHQSSPEDNSATDQKTVPIGHPIANTQIYLLDQHLNPVCVGITGEVYIGGVGVGRGYLNNPELTAEKFIPNPLSNKSAARLYKTGDLARYLTNGEIEYIGRIDHQVKLRGFRIELGEIEALIGQHPAAREAVVVVCSDEAASQRLVAYVVLQREQTLTITQLRHFLESKLPNYMVPAAFVMLEALPLTPNGKIDRKALPAPEVTQLLSESDFIAPSTPIEEMLALIWAEVLGIEKVGIHNNFFELGGHSLLATRVISQVRQVFQQELPLRRLFEQPTIAGLAKDIEKASKAGLGLEAANIEQISRSQELPLSFAQQRLWFLAQLEPNSPFYNMSGAIRLQGQLNLEALQQSFNEILRRHEALRTNFKTVEGQPLAVISSVTPLRLPVFDISELPLNQREAEVKQLAYQEAQQPFNLDSDLLLRVKLLYLEEQVYIVLLTMHHIASDGWSIGVLVRELATLYQAFCDEQPSPLAELPIQYADFAAWQRQWLQGEVLEAQISYWRKQLEGAPGVLELPTDHPRPAVQTFRGATYSFELSLELSVALNKLSQQQGSTLFMTLLAVFKILLWRYTGSEDIVVGAPIANRNRAEIERLIGFFVNTQVLRTNLGGNPTFEELQTRIREVALGAYAHQDLPFEQLVEELQPQRFVSHTPLFQVMFVLQNVPMPALELPGLTLTPVASDSGTAKFDLTLYMTQTAQGLVGAMEYNTDLFEESTISRMAGHLQTLLSRIVANPQQRLSELPLLTQTEKELLVQWNDTSVQYPQHQCIHQLFEAQVERTPDAVAVVFEDEQLTYRELNAKVNQLAHYLQKLGVKPEVLVGICVERSLSMVIGLLGILKAGGAYLPLDPAYPQERLAFMFSNAQVPVLLTQQHLVERLPKHEAQVVCLDADWGSIAQSSQENLVSSSTANNLTYVIYTSGSTGKPKGVLGLHQGAVNRFHWMWETYPFEAEEVCCQKTSLNFVDSVWEIFGPLLQGVQTVIVSDKVLKDPQQFVETLADNAVSRLVLVPSLLRVLLDTCSDLQKRLPKLKLWVTSGEALSVDLLQKFRQTLSESILLNLYGSSEVSADVTCYSISTQDKAPSHISIGRPIANTQIYVLDRHLQPAPIGVPGELYVGGAGLARGYLNRPEMTAERFIPNPFTKSDEFSVLSSQLKEASTQNSKRTSSHYANKTQNFLYKTGDLVRYLPDGNLEFLGRIDNQVKVRGFRIELGEIEAVLGQHPGVRQAIVLAREDEPGNQQLVAYVVSHPEQAVSEAMPLAFAEPVASAAKRQEVQAIAVSELHRLLKEKLPNYMVPSAFVMLEALPLLPNGKVDHRALPMPNERSRPELEAAYQAPRTEVEQTIATIWHEVLHVEEIGIHDNFFELGGHSLLLVQVHGKLQKTFQRDFPLVGMFQYPTISYLAQYLSQEQSEQPSVSQSSNRSGSRTDSIHRRKQVRQKHRAVGKPQGTQSQ